MQTVLIPCAGLGTRLGDLTLHIPKPLVRIGQRPALSYIFDSYEPDTHFILSVGYKSDLMKQYVSIAHPELNVTFVDVDPYEGSGSSLLYSIWQAQEYLQHPFIFHCADTLVDIFFWKWADWSGNWVGMAPTADSTQYRTVSTQDGKITAIHEKGSMVWQGAYIGLIGIQNWKLFWEIVENILAAAPHSQQLSDAHVVEVMMRMGMGFRAINFENWQDTGGVQSLQKARSYYAEQGDSMVSLDKPGQATFLLDYTVVKFFADSDQVSKRVQRAKNLYPAVPNILAQTKNFYSYEKVKGELLLDCLYPDQLEHFLNWAQENLWKDPVWAECEEVNFFTICQKFYWDKTFQRVEQFRRQSGIKDEPKMVNGIFLPSLSELLDGLEWDWICNGIPVKTFHGDLHFSNILRTPTGDYACIDWREDMVGQIDYGDLYYDLSKLYHGMLISHDLIEKDYFFMKMNPEEVWFDFYRHHRIVECIPIFEAWMEQRGYDVKKVRTLTALIFLNCAPLHEPEYGKLLYHLGWKMLFDLREEYNGNR